jgi:hypothetical protein
VLARGAPLYNMAERLALGPVEDSVMQQFLRDRTVSGGKTMSTDVAALICELAGPIPHDIQRLAYESFDIAGKTVTKTVVATGMGQVLTHEAEGYAERFSKLALGQRRLLMGLASSEVTQPQSAEFVRSIGYANAASVRKALTVLEEDETVIERESVYRVVDPFYREWLSRGQ